MNFTDMTYNIKEKNIFSVECNVIFSMLILIQRGEKAKMKVWRFELNELNRHFERMITRCR